MNPSINAYKFPQAPSGGQVSSGAQPNRVGRWGSAVWQSLEAVGRARARRELLTLADRWESGQPELAAELRAAAAPSLPTSPLKD